MTYLTSISCVSLLTVNHKLALQPSLHGVIKPAWGSLLIPVINGNSFPPRFSPTCSQPLSQALHACLLEEAVASGKCAHWIWICAFAFNSGLAPSLFGSGLQFCHFKMRRRSCILFLSCRDTSDGYVRFSWGQLSCMKRKTDRSSGCHSLVMNANYTPVVPYEEHVVSARSPLTIPNFCPRNNIRNNVSEKMTLLYV